MKIVQELKDPHQTEECNLNQQVAIVECPEYEPEKVAKGIQRLVDLLGGWKEFARPGENIVIKPNLLMKKRPDEAVTTHPSVVEAVAGSLTAAGAKVIIADSPGGPFNVMALRRIYKGCGLEEAARRTGANLNENTDETAMRVPAGGIVASIAAMDVVAQADGVVSLSKMKTHGMTRFTGAVKNLFGVIPGLKKAEYHVSMPRVEDFSSMLVDVVQTINPRLHIMDAVVGMEGEGPSAGAPVTVGLLMASRCPHSLDRVAVALAGINAMEVPTIVEAIRRGYISEDIGSIPLLGDTVVFPRVPFRLPPLSKDVDLLRVGSRGRIPGWMSRTLNRQLRPYPSFSSEICIGCGECSRLCPPQAIDMKGKIPHVDMERCIRCFCCQELCPHKAVMIKRPWLGRQLFR